MSEHNSSAPDPDGLAAERADEAGTEVWTPRRSVRGSGAVSALLAVDAGVAAAAADVVVAAADVAAEADAAADVAAAAVVVETNSSGCCHSLCWRWIQTKMRLDRRKCCSHHWRQQQQQQRMNSWLLATLGSTVSRPLVRW